MGPPWWHWTKLMIQRDVRVYCIGLCISWHPFEKPGNHSVARKRIPRDAFGCFQFAKPFPGDKALSHVLSHFDLYRNLLPSLTHVECWFLWTPLVRKLNLISDQGSDPGPSSSIRKSFYSCNRNFSFVNEHQRHNALRGGLTFCPSSHNDSSC